MAYLAQAFSRKAGSTMDLIRDLFRGQITGSGMSVNAKSAMQVSAVFAGCRVLGEGVAQVPLKLMQESGRLRLPAKEHPLYQVLGFRPNPWMTSFEYREMIVWHTVLTGNHFSFINRVQGKIVELIPFEHGAVTVKRAKDGTLTYEIQINGEIKPFPAESIWHIKGPTWNGWQGLDCVKQAREAIGLSMAIEESQSSLHKHGVQSSGVYSVDGTLKDDQYKALSEWINAHQAGSANAGKALILDRAAKWASTAMTGVDSQTLETRRFQIEEICRFMRVSPIMVYGSDKASTYAGSKENFLAHLVHTLAPWYQRIEQSIDANLLTEKERKAGYYSNFVEEGLMRTSVLETKDILLGYVNGGLMTPNEGRAKLDLNPMDDEESDELRIPANIVGAVPEPVEPVEEEPTEAEIETEKAISGLQMEVKSLTSQLINKTQPINVDARTTVSMPEMKQGDTHVTLPEMKASDVNVQVDAPVTHVSASPPVFEVHPSPVAVKAGDVIVQPAEVNVNLPARRTDTTVVRDKDGNIKTATQLERDA